MKLIQIKPVLHKFENIKEFIDEFKISQGDCIFTVKFLYKTFLEPLNLTEIEYLFFEDYGSSEPSDEIINKILLDISNKNNKITRIIAIGGGSVIDIAKLLTLKNTGNALQFFEKSVEIKKEKELILIPTTCGTGSEVTNISIAEIKSKSTKMGLVHDELFANHAVLIAELVKELPFVFFAASAIDALVHAMESFLSPKATPLTEIFSIKAINMILSGFKQIIERDKEYRKLLIEDFLLASAYAGIAFGNAGVGAVHALSYPLGSNYHVPHGEANYQFLTSVFNLYQEKNPNGKIKTLNSIIVEVINSNSKNIYDDLEKFLDKILSRKPLKDYGMKETEIKSFANSVITEQQRLLGNSYISLSLEELEGVYRGLY